MFDRGNGPKTNEIKMSVYTCITCRVAFADADIQRAHYKTDWHRYNLKRKVAEMVPVSAENFQQRVLTQQAQIADKDRDTSTTCTVCSKHFSTQNAFENHVKSKKHREVELKELQRVEREIQRKNEKNEEKGLESSAETDKRLTKDSVNMALKTKLEAKQNGKKLAVAAGTSSASPNDEEMLLDEDDESDGDSWNEEMLGIEECLFCSHVSKSLEENIKHMTTIHSFFLPDADYVVDLEGLITYLGEKVGVGHVCLWCNEKGKAFHTTKAVQRHMLDKGHCKMLHEGDVVFEYADYYDYRSSYPDHRQGAGAERLAEDEEEEVATETLLNDGYELVLPSGVTVGHRSLMKYYRQNLPPQRNYKTKAIMPRVLAQYKALGWTGVTGGPVAQRVKDLGFMQRLKHKHYMQIGVKANSFQKHFRSQNPI